MKYEVELSERFKKEFPKCLKKTKEALDFLYKILYNYIYPKLYKELLT